MNEMITVTGLFVESTKAADAIDKLHLLGIPENDIEVLTGVPYPEQALGRHREWLRLPYVVLGGALAGLTFGIFLSVITPSLYPLTLGGRSIVTGPPAAIITYVFTMMFTVVSTFLGVLWEMGFPSFESKHYNKLVTSGYIAVLLECSESQEEEITAILESHGGLHIHRSERMAI
jgi:hypothetical protein